MWQRVEAPFPIPTCCWHRAAQGAMLAPDPEKRATRAASRPDMTEMVYGSVPSRDGEPILPRWWRTVDKWSISCVLALFGIGLLLGLAASPPLAERHGFGAFHVASEPIEIVRRSAQHRLTPPEPRCP